MLFYGLPTLSPHLRFTPFTTACLAVTIWGGAFNTENFRAGFEAVPFRYREAGLALGFSRIATFFRVTLPIGGRISLPSTINTHVSVLKNTSLMTAIGFQELTSTSRSISASNFRDVEMLTTSRSSTLCSSGRSPGSCGCSSGASRSRRRSDPPAARLEPRDQHRDVRRRGRFAIPWFWHKYENRPLWWDPVQHQIIHVGPEGDPADGGALGRRRGVIGLVLGTLMTIAFRPSRMLIRAYVEVWRGLPIIVTIFLIYFALPRLRARGRSSARSRPRPSA